MLYRFQRNSEMSPTEKTAFQGNTLELIYITQFRGWVWNKRKLHFLLISHVEVPRQPASEERAREIYLWVEAEMVRRGTTVDEYHVMFVPLLGGEPVFVFREGELIGTR